MKEKRAFYICKHCGNIISMIKNSGVPVVCCGEKMIKLLANTADGAFEKHVPELYMDNNTVTVQVGSTLHPSTEEHYIKWIYLHTKNGGQRKLLKPGSKPVAKFELVDDEVVAVYAYCNLHSLWKKDV